MTGHDDYASKGYSLHKTVQRISFRCAIDATKKRVSCEAYEDVATKPRLEVRESSLVVTLPFVEKASAGLPPDETAVMRELSRTQLLSRGNIERRTGFSKDKTVRILNNLALRGLVAKEGVGRSRRYRRA